MKKLLQSLFVVSVVFAASFLPAQETPKKDTPEAPRTHKFYKLSFLIYELEDGKKINERSYTFPAVTEGRRSSMKIGTRVPIVVKESQVQGVKESQIQYLDIGLDISCDLSEVADKVAVNSILEIDSLAGEQSNDSPVVRQIKQNFTTVVTPGKPALVTTTDDINSKKRTQVELTATRIE